MVMNAVYRNTKSIGDSTTSHDYSQNSGGQADLKEETHDFDIVSAMVNDVCLRRISLAVNSALSRSVKMDIEYVVGLTILWNGVKAVWSLTLNCPILDFPLELHGCNTIA